MFSFNIIIKLTEIIRNKNSNLLHDANVWRAKQVIEYLKLKTVKNVCNYQHFSF